ncbi:MAG TPA: phosphotransferase [Actinomycetes bacterium]
MLARHAPGLAPLPHLLDQAAPPLVAMELLPGRPLGARLDARQLAALAGVHATLHRITPAITPLPLEPVVGRPPALLARAGAMLDPGGARRPDAGPLRRGAVRLWRRWSTGPDPGRLLAPAAAVFGRGDPNLANSLWDGTRVAIVDLEYAGWTDRAVDLADLVEHAQARGTPDDDWASLVGRFELDPREHARLLAARRLLAFFWLALSLRDGQDPPSTVDPSVQLQRVLTLLSEA